MTDLVAVWPLPLRCPHISQASPQISDTRLQLSTSSAAGSLVPPPIGTSILSVDTHDSHLVGWFCFAFSCFNFKRQEESERELLPATSLPHPRSWNRAGPQRAASCRSLAWTAGTQLPALSPLPPRVCMSRKLEPDSNPGPFACAGSGFSEAPPQRPVWSSCPPGCLCPSGAPRPWALTSACVAGASGAHGLSQGPRGGGLLLPLVT